MTMNLHQSAIAEVDEANFGSVVLASEAPVLVAFLAPWSRPCQVLGSALDAVVAACAGKVKVVTINVDDNPDLGLVFEIQSIPTILYFVNGLACARIVGTASKKAILAKLKGLNRTIIDRPSHDRA